MGCDISFIRVGAVYLHAAEQFSCLYNATQGVVVTYVPASTGSGTEQLIANQTLFGGADVQYPQGMQPAAVSLIIGKRWCVVCSDAFAVDAEMVAARPRQVPSMISSIGAIINLPGSANTTLSP